MYSANALIHTQIQSRPATTDLLNVLDFAESFNDLESYFYILGVILGVSQSTLARMLGPAYFQRASDHIADPMLASNAFTRIGAYITVAYTS